MLGLLITAGLYLAASAAVGTVTWFVCNPYGHLTRRQQLSQALELALTWPWLLAKLAGLLAYEWWRR